MQPVSRSAAGEKPKSDDVGRVQVAELRRGGATPLPFPSPRRRPFYLLDATFGTAERCPSDRDEVQRSASIVPIS